MPVSVNPQVLAVCVALCLTMAVDDATFAVDYLGRRQPMATPRLSLTSGGPGAGVTAAPTPSVGARTDAAVRIMRDVAGIAGDQPSDASQALSFAKMVTGAIKNLGELFPHDTNGRPVAPAAAAIGETGETFTDPRFPGVHFPVHGGPGGVDPLAGADLTGPLPPQFTIIETASGPEVVLTAEAAAAAREQGAAGAGAAGASAGGGGAGGGGGSALSTLGGALQFATDVTSNQPDEIKAINAAIDAAATAVAIFGGPFGWIAQLAAPFAKSEVGRAITNIERGDLGRLAIESAPGIAEALAISDVLGLGFDPFGGGHPEVTVHTPAGDVETIHPERVLAGLRLGQQSAQTFARDLGAAQSPADVLALLTRRDSGYGVRATSSKGEAIGNPGYPNVRPFTAADLSDPAALASLRFTAGDAGDVPGLADALRRRIGGVSAQQDLASAPTVTMPETPVAPRGPSGAMDFALDLIPDAQAA